MKRITALPPIVALTLSVMPALAKDGVYIGALSKCLIPDEHRMLNCGGEVICNKALKTCSYAGVTGTLVPAHSDARKVEIKRK